MFAPKPRLLFKDDRDSGIGRGAILGRLHFRPEVWRMIEVAIATAPAELLTVEVTEAWRPLSRETRDLHCEYKAFDFGVRALGTTYTDRLTKAQAWSDRMTLGLGSDYDVVLHAGETNLHIHCELDPKPPYGVAFRT